MAVWVLARTVVLSLLVDVCEAARFEEIVQRVKVDVGKGFREFWLTAQDVGCYGKDIGSSLAGLLESVCSVEGDFRVRVGMMTPNSVVDGLDDLVSAFEDDKVFKFVHLPSSERR